MVTPPQRNGGSGSRTALRWTAGVGQERTVDVRSFVQALFDSEKASAVIRGIVGLARSLGMKTVAEGVESQRQLAELKDDGCDVIQGYLISRPLESDAFAAFMLRL